MRGGGLKGGLQQQRGSSCSEDPGRLGQRLTCAGEDGSEHTYPYEDAQEKGKRRGAAVGGWEELRLRGKNCMCFREGNNLDGFVTPAPFMLLAH